MGVNNYQTILRIELNDQMCYSEHHLMVPEHFYCWVAGSFNDKIILKNCCLDFVLNWHNDVSMSCDECVLKLNGLVNYFQKCITICRLRKFV